MIEISDTEIVAEMRRAYPREAQIALLTVGMRKQDERIRQLEGLQPDAAGQGAGFWDGADKPVPLRAEKDKGE